jgi:class 3 adenylate cyclase
VPARCGRYDRRIAAKGTTAESNAYPLVEVTQPKVKPIVVAIRDSLEIGRDCDGLLLSDPEVSRRHVMLSFDGKELSVEDLGSTNGTMVNGVLLTTTVPLWATDVVQLGRTELRLLAAIGKAGAAGGARTSGGDAVVRGHADSGAARMTSIDVVADSVGKESKKVAKLAADGGTITIVFSDIESSTEMAMKLGDTAWFDVLGEHNEIIRRNLAQYDGTEIKSQGDGFMLTFPSARSAMLCMIDIQTELARRAKEHDVPIKIRIGLHTGEAIVDADGDLFGKHIIMAARIANLAEGGQILASSITKEITSSRGDLQFGEAREVTLKGIEGSYSVHEVIWSEPA